MGRALKNSLELIQIETRRTRGVPECMRISRFMHGVNNPELIKRLNEHVPKTLEEMMTADPRLLYGEKPRLLLRRNQRIGEGPDTTTDECVQLKKQIEELVRAGRLSHFIKEIWQDKDQQKTELDRIIEITSPPLTVSKGTKGPLVIEAEIGGHAVHRMYVDGGSSMEWGIQYGRRQLRLLVTIGDAEHSTKAWMNFMIVRSPSPYNGIIGRPEIREIQAVPSTAHGMIKFPVNGGIVTIRSTILTPTECVAIAATPKDTEKKVETRHKIFKVAIHPDFPNQEIAIGGALLAKGQTELCALLKANLDIFAWQPSDMTGVPRSIAEH
ncbi:hypothetical protein Tco_0691282 [Tanacetum coccineum]